MANQITRLRPGRDVPALAGLSSALPPDLLARVRERVRLLALLLLVAFGLDPVLFFSRWLASVVGRTPFPEDVPRALIFQSISLTVVALSAGLWWIARDRRVPASRLHTLGLVYEVTICFAVATLTPWQYYVDHGLLPNLTWVPAVIILFPLIMPGPPRRMLLAAIAAGATVPLAILLLRLTGRITASSGDYVIATYSSAIAVGFSYLGARVVYGLGREVAVAREMGSYQLEERLGQGGMGEVWRARHRMLARPAAIKLIRPTVAGTGAPRDDFVVRFEREAQAIAGLCSPHTVELFDFGVADDGGFYYAMELLDGLDADTLVRQFGQMPAERAIPVLRQICHSLDEAESRGLVHRDIKPANIFLCRYGREYDFVKVLDFGLVKAVHDSDGQREGLTRETAIHGTPAFIAPEQAMGKSDIDGRADIYATGCVAYWLLTGRLVFEANSPQGFLVQHASTSPAPPSARTDQPIPSALDALILRCLAKEPGDRPQTARELSDGLAAVVTPERWTEARSRAWWQEYVPAPSRIDSGSPGSTTAT